jgi:hypothetical protein
VLGAVLIVAHIFLMGCQINAHITANDALILFNVIKEKHNLR